MSLVNNSDSFDYLYDNTKIISLKQRVICFQYPGLQITYVKKKLPKSNSLFKT